MSTSGVIALILVLIALVGVILLCVYTKRFTKKHSENRTNWKKPLIIAGIISVATSLVFMAGMLCCYPAMGITSEVAWYYWLAAIFGSFIFALGVCLFFATFFFHYYGKFIPIRLDQWLFRSMMISFWVAIVFLFVMSEGYAQWLEYPLINGISFSEGWVDPSQDSSIAFYAIFILVGAFYVYALCDHHFYVHYGKHGELDGSFIVGLVMGIVGARVWYVIGNWSSEFKGKGFTNMIAIWNGGLTVIGGVIFGIGFGALWFWLVHRKKKEYSLLVMMDFVVPCILIAQAVGRWGNFFNIEVYGNLVSESYWSWLPTIVVNNLAFSGGGRPVAEGMIHVPLFFIEGVVNIAGYYLIMDLFGKKLRKYLENGDLAISYVIFYGLVRTFMEPLRYSTYNMGSNGYWSWIWSICFVAIGMFLIVLNHMIRTIYRRQKGKLCLNKNTCRNSFICTLVFSICGLVMLITGASLMSVYPGDETLVYSGHSVGVILLILGIAILLLDIIPIVYLSLSYPHRKEETSVSRYNVCIFDLDGTLANTDDLVLNSYKHLYELYKNGMVPSDKKLYSFSGPQLRDVIRQEFPDQDTETLAQEFYTYSANLYDDVETYPNAVKTVKYLHDKGVRIAVFTNKRHELAVKCLKQVGLYDYIEVIVGYEDVTERKPNPQGIETVLNALDYHDKNRVLYIGDSPLDFQTSITADVDFCHVNWGPRDYNETLCRPYTIKNYSELRNIV